MTNENSGCTSTNDDLFLSTSRIAAAYLEQNSVELEDMHLLISTIHRSLQRIANLSNVISLGKNPAVPISESVQEDYIVCLEDGKRLSMLKRHLFSTYGLTIEQYKERWGLPADYPTVSAAYTKRRSQIAREIGLGKTGRKKRGKAKVFLQEAS